LIYIGYVGIIGDNKVGVKMTQENKISRLKIYYPVDGGLSGQNSDIELVKQTVPGEMLAWAEKSIQLRNGTAEILSNNVGGIGGQFVFHSFDFVVTEASRNIARELSGGGLERLMMSREVYEIQRAKNFRTDPIVIAKRGESLNNLVPQYNQSVKSLLEFREHDLKKWLDDISLRLRPESVIENQIVNLMKESWIIALRN
jgi:hypothetical protein